MRYCRILRPFPPATVAVSGRPATVNRHALTWINNLTKIDSLSPYLPIPKFWCCSCVRPYGWGPLPVVTSSGGTSTQALSDTACRCPDSITEASSIQSVKSLNVAPTLRISIRLHAGPQPPLEHWFACFNILFGSSEIGLSRHMHRDALYRSFQCR